MTEPLEDSLRDAVGRTLEQATNDSRIGEDTKAILAELVLTYRGDGEEVLDVVALLRRKAADSQWMNEERIQQERYINPTRLPMMMTGLSGVGSDYYLTYVQRPLDAMGANGPLLAKQAQRLADQYRDKSKAEERTRLFGGAQRALAKTVFEACASQTGKDMSGLSSHDQFAVAAELLHCPQGTLMANFYRLAVALSATERLKAKATRLIKAAPNFQEKMRKLAGGDIGVANTNRLRDLMRGFKSDLGRLQGLQQAMVGSIFPVLEKLQGDRFNQTFEDLHVEAARFDAVLTRWTIILTEAGNPDPTRPVVNRIRGMHEVMTKTQGEAVELL